MDGRAFLPLEKRLALCLQISLEALAIEQTSLVEPFDERGDLTFGQPHAGP
jgi:hypothetical protein